MTAAIRTALLFGGTSAFICFIKPEKYVAKMSSISELRKEYSRKGIDDSEIPDDPLKFFRQWFDEVFIMISSLLLSILYFYAYYARHVILTF